MIVSLLYSELSRLKTVDRSLEKIEKLLSIVERECLELDAYLSLNVPILKDEL